jgi:hypothetical protein
MTVDLGRPVVSLRIFLGALIINHFEKLVDRAVNAAIMANPDMQFFTVLKKFTTQPVFNPSLFVDIRKKAGNKVLDLFNVELIKSISKKDDKKHNRQWKDNNNT